MTGQAGSVHGARFARLQPWRGALGFGLVAVVAAVAAGALTTGGLGPGGHGPGSGHSVVVTQVPRTVTVPATAEPLDLSRRYPIGSRVVVATRTATATPELQVLSTGLAAAGAPTLSPDGERVAFAGRATPTARWGVYEVETRGGTPRALVLEDRDCGDPAYLAHGAIGFVCAVPASGPTAGPSSALFVRQPDGGVKRITFGPGAAFDPSALSDGRIVFAMTQPWHADPTDVGLYTISPDGALLDGLAGVHDDARERHPRPTSDGRVVLVSAAGREGGRRLERLDLGQPDSSRVRLTVTGASPGTSAPVAIAPTPGGGYLLALELDPAGGRGIYSASDLGRDGLVVDPAPIVDSPDWDEVEALAVAAAPAPRGRPAIPGGRTEATLVCYDAARSDQTHGPAAGAPRPAAVEVLGLVAEGERPLGRAPIAGDGSFYVEIPGDAPIRLQTVDEAGRQIAACAWVWSAAGEARACFGCHEGHTAAPVNRAAIALDQPPVAIARQTERP